MVTFYIMATGVNPSKQKLTSCNHIESMPLPSDSSSLSLKYEGKASVASIMSEHNARFITIGDNPNALDEVPLNSFMLTDNFSGLHKLLKKGIKVNLFYLDPPYSTGFDFHSRDLERAYQDTMKSATYIEFMRRRLIIMRECMTDDASIYIHIGHQMLAHLKIVMDEIFGQNNFRNLITRRKCSSKNFTTKQYSNLNDYILFYTKSNNYKWHQPGVAPDQAWIEKEYPKTDEIGRRFKLVPIHAPGIRNGETGKEWRGKSPPKGKHWQYTPSKLDQLDQQGDIHWSKNGNPRRKVYWTKDKKIALSDYWLNYRDAHHQSIKITGYPTEKNYEMLKMIIQASSDEGDLIVDPFCGSGTTIHAAMSLNRHYIGMDASLAAAKASINRFRHGTKKMGDFVSSTNIQSKNTVSQKKICSNLNFLVEDTLWEKFRDEIQIIANI